MHEVCNVVIIIYFQPHNIYTSIRNTRIPVYKPTCWYVFIVGTIFNAFRATETYWIMQQEVAVPVQECH